jgi:tetratricopeptide (TPR) repeat protein
VKEDAASGEAIALSPHRTRPPIPMKPLLILISILLAALLGSFLVWGVSRSPAVSAQASAPSELAELRAELQALEKRLDSLQKGTQLESAGGARLSQSDVDAAVERALAARGDSVAAQSATHAPAAPGKLDAQSAFAQLTDGSLSWEDRRKKWNELAKAGLLDEVLALYEKQAAENPNDPKAQTALGNAYLNKLFNSPQGPEAGVWGSKADKAFDRALALDDHNWEARYVKAVSLSNWPAFMGKRPEAIANLEILVQQQAQGPLQPHYAQTYLILGNLYKDSGSADKALAMWQQGLALFPNDADMLHQVQLAQQH